MEIRELRPEDFHNGFFETLEKLRSVEDLSISDAEDIFRERMATGAYHTFVAVEGRDVVGAITLFIERKFIRKGGKVGHIEDVATRKGHAGKGIGSQLVARAIEEARRQRCYKVILDCGEHNVPFYEKNGLSCWQVCMRIDI